MAGFRAWKRNYFLFYHKTITAIAVEIMKKYAIVTVDNDEDELFFMKEAFEATEMFQVIAQFESGDELIDWLNNNPTVLPEIILTDLNMPGKNGYDIIEDITSHDQFSHLPVIITSTSSTKSIIDKCLALGAADYIVKPSSFIEYKFFIKDLYNAIKEKQIVK